MLGLESVKESVQDRIALIKLEGIEAVGKVAAKIVFLLLMTVFAIFFIMLLSFAGAFYLGELYGEVNGFLIVTGIYLFLILLFAIFKKSIQSLIVNMVIAASAVEKDDD